MHINAQRIQKTDMHLHNRGFSLVETIFYVAIFVVFSLVVINSIIVMTRSFREVNINTDIMQGANVMDQMTRYIRKSTAITSITGGNDLLLADTVDGYSMEFRLNGTNLEYYQAGALVGNLNSSNISITSLSFTQIDTLKSKAVKISMTVKSNRYGSVRTETFYDTIVLRSTYSN